LPPGNGFDNFICFHAHVFTGWRLSHNCQLSTQLDSESDYDWWFNANQFVLATNLETHDQNFYFQTERLQL
jgi:hypothetical protein